MTTDFKERRKHMAPMSDGDVERIAERVKELITSEFDFDPKDHYDMHKELSVMAGSFNGVRSIFTKVFVSAVIVGGLVMASWSVVKMKTGS